MNAITAAPGTHQLLEVYGARPGQLADIEDLSDLLLEAAVVGGATVLRSDFHSFGQGQGVTGVVLLAESHISIHTWPELSYAAIDVFMCGEGNSHDCIMHIIAEMSADDIELRSVPRGARFNVTN